MGTQVNEARRADLTTIAIPPYPAGYETDHPECFIANTRAHYGDPHHPDCDDVLVGFSKTLIMILRYDIQTGVRSEKVKCVDKNNLTNGVIWPIDEFRHWMGELVRFTTSFRYVQTA